jgi:integrase
MTEKNRIKFRKDIIAALPHPLRGRKWWYDESTRGLALRVSANGSKIFYYYRWVGGTAAQTRLGDFPDMSIEQARKRAEALNGAVAEGETNIKKAAGSTRGERTFGELCEWYMAEHSRPRKKSWRDDEMYIRLHFKGLMKSKLSAIKKSDLRRLHTAIGEGSGKYAANKAIRIVRAIYNKAIAHELYQGINPADGLEEFRETSRRRRLMPSEMTPFIEAVMAEENESVRDFVLLSLFTGARKSNVLAMRWDQINIPDRLWFIPMTKNGTPQELVLEDTEIEILTQRRQRVEGEWVFPGTGATGHMQDPRKGWRRILARSGLQDIRLHDLRRTLGSWMVDTGASLPVIGKTLHHLSPASTAVYARLSQNPVREAKGRAHEAMIKAYEGNGQSDV